MGLRCSHKELYYTSEVLGIGGQIEESTIHMLDNWPHQNSKRVVIISIPNKYRIFSNQSLGTYGLEHAAYCYSPFQDDSVYIYPEFVYGYYDAIEKKFVRNPIYYDRLAKSDQNALFETIRNRYIYIVDECIGLKRYKDIISSDFPEIVLPEDVDFENYFIVASKGIYGITLVI